MKKTLPFLMLAFVLFFGFNMVHAQCTPDPDCTELICPAELATAYEAEAYDETITINVPLTWDGFTVHHIDVLSISNFPANIGYVCQDNDCSFYPEIPKCISITGTPEAGASGEYELLLTLEGFIDVGGNAMSIGELEETLIMTVSIVDGIETAVISGLALEVNPNPFQNSIKISTNASSDYSLRIFDVSGKEITSIPSFKKDILDVSNLDYGVYFLQVQSENKTETIKIIKQ
ncbi:MAG: T9SS type A sorting domain-containing protein [Bacteroidales bacterium]|nr:T9SS type A sorting domain-containing protein [Bacteroidales bacterium]